MLISGSASPNTSNPGNLTGSDGIMFVFGTSVVRWKEGLVVLFFLLLWLYSVNR